MWQSIRGFFNPVLDHDIRTILAEELATYIRRMSRIRVLATILLTAMSLYASFVLRQKDWLDALPVMILYAVAAFAIELLLRSGRGLVFCRFAAVLVDIPLLFWGAYASIPANPFPQVAACFAIAGFAVFIILLPVEIRPFTILIASVEGIVLSTFALHGAGVHFPKWFPSVVFLFLVVGLSALLVRNRAIRIAEQYANERRATEHLGRFFSPNLTQFITSHGGLASVSGRKKITLLFSDIRGFTRLSEKLDPGEVVALLNRYFEAMVAVIFKNGGTLDKFIGDGIMAYFGAPLAQADQAKRAVTCAREMMVALDDLNAGLPPAEHLKIGIGVHTGEVILGEVGSPDHKDFTAIGDAVNLSSRIESLTKDKKVPILVSESSWKECKADFQFKSLGSVKVRGKQKAVKVFTVLRGKA
jgi:adenylate cyclase